MTKFKANLQLMRNEWYNAFYTGDTGLLDYLETDWFMSTNGRKFIYKKHQLRKLAMSDTKDQTAQIQWSEMNVITREFNEIACVSGQGIITDKESVTHINFIENWIKINGGWKLQFVSFEPGLNLAV